MAITRLQQAKQMLQDGGRIGFKKGRDTDYQQRGTDRQTYSATQQQQNFSARDNRPTRDDRERYITDYSSKQKVKGGGKKKEGPDFLTGGGYEDRDFSDKTDPTNRQIIDRQRRNYQDQFTSKGRVPPGPNRKARQRALNFINKNMLIDYNRFGKYYDPNKFGVTKTGYPNLGFPNVYDLIDEELDARKDIRDILKTGNRITGEFKGGIPYTELNPIPDLDIDSIRELASTQTTLQGAPLTGYQADALEDLRGAINRRDNLLETGDTSNVYPKPPEPAPDDDPMDPCKGPNPPAYCFIGDKADENQEAAVTRNLSGLTPRIGGSIFNFDNMADGGLADMDREAFLLGGIAKGLKKAVKGVKKLVKSPIGKAALLGAVGFGLGGKGAIGSFFGKGSFNPFLRKVAGDTAFSGLGSILSKAGLVNKAGSLTALGMIGVPTVASLFMTPKEDENDELAKYLASQKLDPSLSIKGMGSDFDYDFYGARTQAVADGGRIGYQEGGDAEPVAKKTMPLLDMGGKEKDYRETGGFVDMGRMERADDVPARLSKNEFVFTADAVRNAGEGDIDKGAEVMYNMMKNLEAGGEVSEESQGLEGARKMFQTSQRLEGVM